MFVETAGATVRAEEEEEEEEDEDEYDDGSGGAKGPVRNSTRALEKVAVLNPTSDKMLFDVV